MLVTAIPLTNFVHGHITADEGRPMLMEEGLAHDLEQHGLIRIKLIARRVDQALSLGAGAAIVGTDAGKAPGDGEGQPSPSLHQAPLSMTQTLPSSKPGAGSRRKSGA